MQFAGNVAGENSSFLEIRKTRLPCLIELLAPPLLQLGAFLRAQSVAELVHNAPFMRDARMPRREPHSAASYSHHAIGRLPFFPHSRITWSRKRNHVSRRCS